MEGNSVYPCTSTWLTGRVGGTEASGWTQVQAGEEQPLSLRCWGRGEGGGEGDTGGKPEGAALGGLQINSLLPKLAEGWVHRDSLTRTSMVRLTHAHARTRVCTNNEAGEVAALRRCLCLPQSQLAS